jgi:hypothetical protein
MFEHLNRLWKRIERIGSMNLCSTYQRYPSAPPPEFPSDQEPTFPSLEGPDPDIPSTPPPELPSDPEPVLPFDPNPDTYPYREIPSADYRPESWIRRENAVSGLKGLQSGGPGEYRFCEAFYHR